MKEKKKEYKASLYNILKKLKLTCKTLNQKFPRVKVFANRLARENYLTLFKMQNVKSTIKVLNYQRVTWEMLLKVESLFHKTFLNNLNLNIPVKSLNKYPHNCHKIQDILRIYQEDQFKKVIIKVNHKKAREVRMRDHSKTKVNSMIKAN